MQREGARMAYYTSASTAVQILRHRQIWMRNTQVMNDFSEVEHGIACVRDALRSETGRQFGSLVNTFYPGLFEKLIEQFEGWIPGFRLDTFIACVSEHHDEDATFGRLSMWRAYGGKAGVALVLNPGVFFRPSDALGAYSMPVFYSGPENVVNQLREITARMSGAPGAVGNLGADGLQELLFSVLRYASVCTKHPAFKEEREWRVVASPALYPNELLQPSLETIGDVPQVVLKLPLMEVPERGLTGISPESFIERILIGPCEHPDVLFRALHTALEGAGVSKPGERIIVTNIPLRANQR